MKTLSESEEVFGIATIDEADQSRMASGQHFADAVCKIASLSSDESWPASVLMKSRIPARLLKHLIENGLFGESHRLEHQEA